MCCHYKLRQIYKLQIVIPRPKKSAAYAHHRTSRFNGQFKITGHPHTEFLKIAAVGKIPLLDLIKQHFKAVKFALNLCFILGEGGHAHEASQFYKFQLLPCTGCQRSEEHTSELQSRPHLVCRLL